MHISVKSTAELENIVKTSQKEIFCGGLLCSAKWFVCSKVGAERFNLIVLPDSEQAQYCCSDLYSLVEGDKVFYLPSNLNDVGHSSYKATLDVQRTNAVQMLSMARNGDFVVTYPEALEQRISSFDDVVSPVLELGIGDEILHDKINETLFNAGFERVDFVSVPGQYTLRGSIVDIFSYSYNFPYRISFFGSEIESISVFDPNSQKSIEKIDSVSIFKNSSAPDSTVSVKLYSLLKKDCLVWLDSADIYKESESYHNLESYQRVFIGSHLNSHPDVQFSIARQPSFGKNFNLIASDIRRKISDGYEMHILCQKQTQAERLKSIFENEYLIKSPLGIDGEHTVHEGFIDNENKVCVYSDHEIFERFHRVSLRKSVEKSEQLTLNDLTSFAIGDYIVHIDHGIGIFGGLVKKYDDKGRVQEVIKLTYKDGDVIFLSVHALHKLSRYKSKDATPPSISSLGSARWQNLKTNAKSRVKDIAKELIGLYAKRKMSKGYAFSADTYLQEQLESSFIYEDTPDQEITTRAVKEDMENPYPMDRLVCGDVGFGKTEIAIRAAFKAVADSKQVAVLVPTTILALQHFETFKQRLKDFPCNVEMISRLRKSDEVRQIAADLEKGKIDILIGTHKILSSSLKFKDLGLLIIDEEQKFGVSAKEKLRQFKVNIDTLTLTATPIPRTLQFSLLGARDLSIINTPPSNRIPVQTRTILFNPEEIKAIVEYEVNRGGQVFFIHNRVEELESIYEILHRIMPEIKITTAHGQMESTTLENRIIKFMKGDSDLLLCTTIVENGLDIPNCNTIIINQAQNIGLSDLHQLRGRVGRSNRKAFCYLLVPPLATLTSEARRRLSAIEAFSDLGSGFNIAMQDLDIRGAGNLLGAQQSGFISDMGLETYQKVLQEAMSELGIETGTENVGRSSSIICDSTVDTDQPAYIPDDYLDVVSEKIRIYKNFEDAQSIKEIDNAKAVLIDRFGHIPPEVENFINVVKIRLIASMAGIEKVIVKNGLLICYFIGNASSPFYKSARFSSILDHMTAAGKVFELSQSQSKLKLLSRGVDSLEKALKLLSSL